MLEIRVAYRTIALFGLNTKYQQRTLACLFHFLLQSKDLL